MKSQYFLYMCFHVLFSIHKVSFLWLLLWFSLYFETSAVWSYVPVCIFLCHPACHWRRKWQPTPMLLPGEPQGWGAWWAAVSGVAQSQTRPKWLSSSIAASCMWLTGFLGFISEYLWSNFRNLRPLFLQILFLPCFFPFFSRTLITIILDEIIFINRPLGICSFHLNCFLPPHLVDEIISIHLLSKSSNCSFMFNMLLSTSNEFFMLLHFSVLVFHLLPFNSFNFSAEILHQFIYHAYILFKIFEHICNITQMHRTRPKTTNYPASKVNSAEAGKSCIIGS